TLFDELCFIEPKARAMHQQVHSIRSIQSTIKVDSTLPLRDRIWKPKWVENRKPAEMPFIP
ncbi:hypothetical protein COS70_05170, partial [Candidatus Micrarchaeota archaeon CG06_land_8_20_14_3_00_50_6]